MIRQYVKKLIDIYGIEENEKEMKKDFYIFACIFVVLFVIIRTALPSIIADYFLCIGGILLITLVCAYFYRKKKNSHRFKRVKQISFWVSLSILLVMLSPCILMYGIILFLSKATDKVYIFSRYPMCFLAEGIYHILVVTILIEITILNINNLLYLVVSYSVFIIGDTLLSALFRVLLIRRKNCYYERYKYAKEMDIISEYIFLITTVISVICTASEYSYAFIPILLWYSIKQMNNYRKEKKNSSLVRSFLIDTLNDIEEMYEIYIEVMADEELVLCNYIEEKKIDRYIIFNSQRKFWNFFKSRHIQEALTSIQRLSSMVYRFPKEKEKAKEDMERVMNDIVKCI